QRQRLGPDAGESGEVPGCERLLVDVADHARQVTQLSLRIDHARLLVPVLAEAAQFHLALPCSRTPAGVDPSLFLRQCDAPAREPAVFRARAALPAASPPVAGDSISTALAA